MPIDFCHAVAECLSGDFELQANLKGGVWFKQAPGLTPFAHATYDHSLKQHWSGKAGDSETGQVLVRVRDTDAVRVGKIAERVEQVLKEAEIASDFVPGKTVRFADVEHRSKIDLPVNGRDIFTVSVTLHYTTEGE